MTTSATFRRGLATVGFITFVGAVVVPASANPNQSADPTAFTYGRGSALADVVVLAPTAGQVQLRMGIEAASATYHDETFTSRSAPVDIPILALASGLSICGRKPGDLAAAIPPAQVADTGNSGNTEPESSEESNGFGRNAVAAEPGARSWATAIASDLDLPGLVQIQGGDATTEIVVDPATGSRTATAITNLGTVRLAGGLVTLRGLRWRLTQAQVGPDDRNDTRTHKSEFTVEGVELGSELGTVPLPVPGGSIDDAAAAVNAALGPLGVEIRPPVASSTEGVDSHRISPLTVAIGGSELAAPALQLLAGNQQVQDLLAQGRDTLWDPTTCNELGGVLRAIPELQVYWNLIGSLEPALTTIVLAILAEQGEIQISLGGVATSLDDSYVAEVQFGGFLPPSSATPPAPSAPTVLPASPVPADAPVPSRMIAAEPSAASGFVCRTTSPADRPNCWLGRAEAAAFAAAAVTLGFLGLDERKRRRTAIEDRRGVPG